MSLAPSPLPPPPPSLSLTPCPSTAPCRLARWSPRNSVPPDVFISSHATVHRPRVCTGDVGVPPPHNRTRTGGAHGPSSDLTPRAAGRARHGDYFRIGSMQMKPDSVSGRPSFVPFGACLGTCLGSVGSGPLCARICSESRRADRPPFGPFWPLSVHRPPPCRTFPRSSHPSHVSGTLPGRLTGPRARALRRCGPCGLHCCAGPHWRPCVSSQPPHDQALVPVRGVTAGLTVTAVGTVPSAARAARVLCASPAPGTVTAAGAGPGGRGESCACARDGGRW